MYAATYTPPITGVKQAPGTIADPEMQSAANAFEKDVPRDQDQASCPGAREFGTPTWYCFRGGRREPARCYWVPGYYVNVTLPCRTVPGLDAGVQKPNPFIPGNTKWISTMNPVALRADTVPGNTPGTSGIFVVNGDWGGIGFYYNKNLFREAGIAAPPETWNQLQADSVQDRRAAWPRKQVYAGAAIAPYMYNWLAHIPGQLPGFEQDANHIQDPRHPMPPRISRTSTPMTASWFNPAKNPEMTALVPLGQGADGHLGPQGRKCARAPAVPRSPIATLFLGQQVAYVFINGYVIPKWSPNFRSPSSSRWGTSSSRPNAFMGTSQYATDLPVWQDNGGPETRASSSASPPPSRTSR